LVTEKSAGLGFGLNLSPTLVEGGFEQPRILDLFLSVVGKQVHCFPHSFSVEFDPLTLGERVAFDSDGLLEAGADEFLPRTSSPSVSVLPEVLPRFRKMSEIKAAIMRSGLNDHKLGHFDALLG